MAKRGRCEVCDQEKPVRNVAVRPPGARADLCADCRRYAREHRRDEAAR